MLRDFIGGNGDVLVKNEDDTIPYNQHRIQELIKSNLPTSLCDSITLVNNKHSHTSRIQDANQVNIPTVRTKTIGSKIIKSKSANIWNYLDHSLFIKREVSANLH